MQQKGGCTLFLVYGFRWLLHLLLTGMLAHLALGQPIEARVPVPGSAMPLYFSGTEARASGWVKTRVSYMVEAKLWVGGFLVQHWQYDGGPIVVFEVPLAVMFDSSHLTHGSQATVRVWGRDNLDNQIEAENSAVVLNRLVAYNLSEFNGYDGGRGAQTVSIMMGNQGYFQYVLTSGWTRDIVAEQVKNSGIHYVNSHGHEVLHAHTVDTPAGSLFFAKPPNAYNYESSRWTHNGSGLPPFNSTGLPPVQFAMFDICDGGPTNQFSSILVPYYDAYDQTKVTDQATVMYPGAIFIDEGESRIYWWFKALRVGKTVDVAKREFLEGNSEEDHPVHIDEATNLVDEPYEVNVFGDVDTRIKKVYTGNNFAAAAQWYRPL